jgi:hypothetical protein
VDAPPSLLIVLVVVLEFPGVSGNENEDDDGDDPLNRVCAPPTVFFSAIKIEVADPGRVYGIA